MFSSPTPVGKRPEFKQAPSSKWSMPHLVSMKEKKPQSTPASSTRRPSEPPSSHDQSDQEPAPTTEGGKADPESRPLSPVLSTAGSATTTKGPDAAGRNEDMLAGETIDDVSTADSDVTGNLLTASEEAMPSWTEPAKGSATQVEDVSPQEEVLATPATTPIPPATDAAGAPVPYYAMPRIMVHKPSSSSVSEVAAPRTIDEVLASERQAEALTTIPPIPAEAPPAPASRLPDVPSGIPEATGNLPKVPIAVPGLPDAAKTLKQKKRVLYKWKARNLAARKTILKATLGRQLAGPTKQALRSLAKGEPVALENLDVVA